MTSSNFSPSITSIHLHTKKDSSELILYKGKNNALSVSCTIRGLMQRTLPYIHETPDYVAIWFTLYHQFGEKGSTIVRRHIVEYDPEQGYTSEDIDHIEFQIPIDDDFSSIDFITNYYYLHISCTGKHHDEMGISASVDNNEIFKTKIPFIVSTDKVV
ncbi:hypothetical protein [Bacillus cereus group sp. BfR-BA-01380]|uniref:hypothetical protein n=1 Tax=Bacillus cereus group sp. BfR-BA-01380 TaxID=2920324 RepID=UPI001F5A54D6|nr:hypothetical protein [Bacillus cereus group sp. BfR-BA-01380]